LASYNLKPAVWLFFLACFVYNADAASLEAYMAKCLRGKFVFALVMSSFLYSCISVVAGHH
jgi:hypothetical protein